MAFTMSIKRVTTYWDVVSRESGTIAEFMKRKFTEYTEVSYDDFFPQPPNRLGVAISKTDMYDGKPSELVETIATTWRMHAFAGNNVDLQPPYQNVTYKSGHSTEFLDYFWVDVNLNKENHTLRIAGNYYDTLDDYKDYLQNHSSFPDSSKPDYERAYTQNNKYMSTGSLNIQPLSGGSVGINVASYDENRRKVYVKLYESDYINLLSEDYRVSYEFKFNGFDYKVFNHTDVSEYIYFPESDIIDYLNNGTIPPNVVVTDNNLGDIADDTPDKPSNENNPKDWKKDNDKDNLEDNNTNDNPSATPIDCKGALNNYLLTSTDSVQNIFKWFWNNMISQARDDDFLSYASGVFGSLGQCVVSIRMYPFSLSSNVTEHMIIGRYESNVNLRKLPSGSNLLCSHTYHVERQYGNFMDYSPYTKILIYLPMIGLKDVDTNLFMDKDIKVKYFVDYTTGGVDCYLLTGNTVISHFNGKIGADIPFTLDSGKDLSDVAVDKGISAIVSTVGTLAGAGVTAIAGPVAGSVVGGVTSELGNMLIGNNDTTNLYSTAPINGNIMNEPNKIQIFYIYPAYSQPSSYGRNVGYVLEKTKTLNTLSGLTVCKNPIVEYGRTTHNNKTVYPYETEIEEINIYLSKGVYL